MKTLLLPPICLLLLAALTACSGDSPTGPATDEVRFEPPPGGLLVAQDSLTRFGAKDPSGQRMTAVFRVDGETKHRGTAYNWSAGAVGTHVIEAEVDLGTHTRTGLWLVEVRYVDVQYVPPVTEFSAVAGARWATLEATWKRPTVPELHPEVSGYRIYYAQEPYGSVHDTGVLWVDLEDDSSRVTQSATLFDLSPTADTYLHIVARNQHGATSVLSNRVVARSRGAGSVDLPPPTQLAVETPDVFESLDVSWNAPALESGSAPLDHYRVFWDEAPFAPDQVANVAYDEIPAAGSTMSHRIVGLRGLTLYHVRVQAFAEDGRASAMTTLADGVTRETPTPFTLAGRAIEVVWTPLSFQPLADAQFRAGIDMTTSDAAGTWVLPTVTQGELHLESDSNGAHYPAHIPIYGSDDQSFDVLFFPKRTIEVVSSQELLDGPMEHVEFVQRFTGTLGGTPHDIRRIHRWESYPVAVQKSTLLHQGNTGEMVDYGFAFERAVAIWNDMVGRELLRLVATAPDVGVSVAVDVPIGAAVLGETRFVDPAFSWFTQDIPVHLRIHLAEFNFQALANRVILHELGHVVGLLHSPSEQHLMSYGAPDFDLSPDEAEVARLLSLLPQGTALSWYLRE